MKWILLPIVFLAMVSCQKDDVDAREALIGSYDVDLVYSGLDEGVPFSETGAGVITVRKGPGDNELLFNDVDEHTAYLDGMTFEMPEFIFVQDGYGWVLSGSGFFKGDGQVEYTLRGKLDDRNTQITNVKGRKR